MHLLIERIQTGENPTFEDFLSHWGNHFELLCELENTPQEPKWHGEGNVAIHTSMVLQEIYKIIDVNDFDLEDKLALIIGAIFHDIGKSLTTKREEIKGRERIVSPRHASRGCSYMAYKILDLGLPYKVTQKILQLIAYHHNPKQLVTKEARPPKWQRLARMGNLQLLYFLEIADLKGRICDDQKEQLEYIELFRMFSEEYNLWDCDNYYGDWQTCIDKELKDYDATTRKFVLANAIREAETGKIFTPQEAVAKSYNYRDSFAQLIVMCGPSGSGKTTWIHNHLPDYTVICLDDLRAAISSNISDQSKNGQVLQKAKELLKKYLNEKRKIVWDATGLRKDFRRTPIQLGFQYNAYVTLAIFHISESIIRERNQQRSQAIPEKILCRQLESVEWPQLDEAHEVIFLDANGNNLLEAENG